MTGEPGRTFRNPVLPGCHPDPTVRPRGQDHSFQYGVGGRSQRLASAHGGFPGSPEAGGFLGVWVGLYASSNGRPSGTVADVDRFDYAGSDPGRD